MATHRTEALKVGGSMDERTARRVQQAIEGLGPLPVLDRTVKRVQALAGLDSGDAQLIATIERDEAFAVNLLRYANSAAFARRHRPSTVSEAVTTIGRRELARLAVEAVTYRFLEKAPGNGGISRGHLHLHAVNVATCAAEAAERAGCDADQAHLAGLLHDIGKLVLPVAFGEDALDRIATAARHGVARAGAELVALGIDHAQAGALVAEHSEAPAAVVEAVRLHHAAASGLSPVTACVQVANAAVALLNGVSHAEVSCGAALAVLGLDEGVLDELAEAITPDATPAAAPPLDPLLRRIAELERRAATDGLTGIANRRHWHEFVLERLIDRRDGAVLICDLDHFKQVNDTYGHAAGDRLLTETARILDRYGFAGRYGGDEFTVWIEEEPRRAASRSHDAVAELAERLAQLPEAGPATVSIGVAMTAKHGHNIDRLLAAADEALYRAKAGGRMRACAA